MAEFTLLRNAATVQNAPVGTSRPSQVNAGALPLVQVRTIPAGPLIQEGQQRPVQILPSKDSVQAGGLPMIQVKMTQDGPQRDDGQNRTVVVRDGKRPVQAGEDR